AVWTCRTYVVIGFECILRSQKMKKQEAADYIEGKYPVFNRLMRNPGASLPKSIQSWRRNIINGRKSDVLDVLTLHKFFEPHDLLPTKCSRAANVPWPKPPRRQPGRRSNGVLRWGLRARHASLGCRLSNAADHAGRSRR